MGYISEIQKAIRRLHGCESSHIETVPVKEEFHGLTIWEGEVEVFDIRGHPESKQCFAWSHSSGKDDKEKRFVAVLAIPPITTAQNAVKAAITQERRIRNE